MKIEINPPILESKFKARDILMIYPLLIIIGKIVRWTIMKATLVGMSIGWSFPNVIMNGSWSWQFFGLDELVDGNIGQGANIYSFFRVFWYLWLKIPNDFYSFEIMITLTWGFMLLLVLVGMKEILSFTEGIFVMLAVIVNSVYCFSLGKEPFQMVFFFLLYFILRSGKINDFGKLIGSVMVILLSIMSFRTYYALILVFGAATVYLYYYVLRNVKNEELYDQEKKIRWNYIIKIALTLTVVYFVMMLLFSILNPNLYLRFRDALLFASDSTSSSNTYIENILSINNSNSNVVTVWIEYVFALVRLCFPVELIFSGPKYWPYIIYQISATCLMLNTARNVKNNTNIQNIALMLFIGYVYCSATFEVDFGAWVRHCAVTVPLILIMAGICPTVDSEPSWVKIVENAENEEENGSLQSLSTGAE